MEFRRVVFTSVIAPACFSFFVYSITAQNKNLADIYTHMYEFDQTPLILRDIARSVDVVQASSPWMNASQINIVHLNGKSLSHLYLTSPLQVSQGQGRGSVNPSL